MWDSCTRNFGTKIRKKAKIFCNFQKSIYLCTRLTAIRIDSLAQQVEHNTFNVGVLGSSPKRITKSKCKTMKTADNQSLSAVFLFIHTANWSRIRINVKIWGIRWLSINLSQPEQKESLVLYSPELWTEALYFCIEGFRCSVCGTLIKEVDNFQIMCLYGSCHSSKGKKSRSVHLVIPSGKSCQSGILMLAQVIYQSESHWKIVCFL